MTLTTNRREFLKASAAGAASLLGAARAAENRAEAEAVRVVVWDEQQPAQKEAYDDFIGNWIAAYLRSRPGFTVKSVRLDDPEQGLGGGVLDACDVLVWWGHLRNKDVNQRTGVKIADRIKAGKLALLALHSAHWSAPFMEAMNERARRDAQRLFPAVWRVGEGRVFYFRPGHETFAVYKERPVLQILENAARWLAGRA